MVRQGLHLREVGRRWTLSRVGGSFPVLPEPALAFANAPCSAGLATTMSSATTPRGRQGDILILSQYGKALARTTIVFGAEDYARPAYRTTIQSASQTSSTSRGGHVVGSEYFPPDSIQGTTVRYRPIFELSTAPDGFHPPLAVPECKWGLNNHFSFNIGAPVDKTKGTTLPETWSLTTARSALVWE